VTNATKSRLRDAGYETLFLMGAFVALAIRPTRGNFDWIFDGLINDSRTKKQQLKRLEDRGLVESELRNGRWVPRLTALGRAVFAGGRQPESAWARPWDGKWRILSFDLPRKERATRMKLRKWLWDNHFGQIQGSVWIHPDPMPAIDGIIDKDRIHPRMMMVFEGNLAGRQGPREVAAAAWDFHSINAAYRNYIDFAAGLRVRLRGKAANVREILRTDRQYWWEAMRKDPLLPKPLLPKGYQGAKAWKARCELLGKLHKVLETKVGRG